MFLLAKNELFYFGMSLPKNPSEGNCTCSRGMWFLGAEALTGVLWARVWRCGEQSGLLLCVRWSSLLLKKVWEWDREYSDLHVPSVWGWFANKLTEYPSNYLKIIFFLCLNITAVEKFLRLSVCKLIVLFLSH